MILNTSILVPVIGETRRKGGRVVNAAVVAVRSGEEIRRGGRGIERRDDVRNRVGPKEARGIEEADRGVERGGLEYSLLLSS